MTEKCRCGFDAPLVVFTDGSKHRTNLLMNPYESRPLDDF